MANVIRRFVQAILDRASLEKTERELAEGLGQAGEKGGANFLRELRAAFDKRMADLKVQLAQGIIDPKQFRAQANLAAQQFNAGIVQGINAARKAGNLTDREFIKLSKTLKRTGDTGRAAMFGIGAGATAAQGPLAALRTGIAALGTTLKAVLGPLIAFFALDRIRRFGQESIQAAIESQQAFDKLAGTLANVGVEYEAVEGQIQDTTRALWESHRLTDDEVAGSLQTLVAISGDYAASLENVGLAADVAAGANMGLEEASELVARTMAGNLRGLKQLGINATDSADGIRQLRERYTGLAKDATPATVTLGKAWGELKEAIGAALFEAGGGTSVIETITGAVVGLTNWIEDNQTAFVRWGRVGVATIKAVWETFLLGPRIVIHVFNLVKDTVLASLNALAAGAGKALNWIPGIEIDVARHSAAAARHFDRMGASLRGVVSAGRDVAVATVGIAESIGVATGLVEDTAVRTERATRRTARATEDLGTATESATTATRDATAASVDRAAALDKEREKALALKEAEEQGAVLQALAREIEVLGRMAVARREGEAAVAALNRQLFIEEAVLRSGAQAGSDFADQVARLAAAQYDAGTALGAAEAGASQGGAAEEFTTPWIDALGILRQEVESQGGLFEELGQAWAQGGFKGLAALAKAKVKENLASAIEMVARALGSFALGNPAAAALYLKSAAQHGIAAAAWKAVGTGAGGGGGGGGGASAGGSPGATNPSLGRDRGAEPRGPEVHIYLTGPGFDAINPEVQRVVHGAQELARERYGENATVRIQRVP